jgi:hypothetical protein
MKTIEEKTIREYHDLILKSELTNMNILKATLFFPVLQGEEIDKTDEGVILLEAKKTGAIKYIRPGFILAEYTDNAGDIIKKLDFAYVTTEYATPFNIKDHYKFLSRTSLKRKELEKLVDLECYLVRNETILGTFKY